ncbi:hypothetical protein MTsPCn9_34510 [Croceitalea sp. MTPC9]|uniref:hypothetical protein n=1 Tax=unclassified Croceitalea TaxID=2632280 RepID=UPI002B36A302|nr:hypothetical protein MTsPCn6_34440 [Croceitalea sp. MTPC6]GMN18511.1 hypothetical protein MTsPCn9_34510 [Croceitalea sp. MTPC9]
MKRIPHNLNLPEKIAVRDCMEILAKTIYTGDSKLNKQLYGQFQDLLNASFGLDLDFNVSTDNVYEISSFSDLKDVFRDKIESGDLTENERSFNFSKRMFAEAIKRDFEKNGHRSARKNLEELFEDSTLKLFPKKLTKENLYSTVMNLKISEVKYRKHENAS